MRYSIIYTVDVPEHGDPTDFAPDTDNQSWDKTEDDKDFVIPDRFSFNPEDPYNWKKGHHRKWYADLDEVEFEAFLERCKLFATHDEGSAIIGVGPNCITRAVVFNGCDDEDCIQEAWVTPYCDVPELVEWLKENHQSVPISLTDSPGQRYLFRGQDRREPFHAVMACLHQRFS